jgi:hypothetical protein
VRSRGPSRPRKTTRRWGGGAGRAISLTAERAKVFAKALRDRGPGVRVGVGTPWCQDDVAWFAANPHRALRRRPAFPGEIPTAMSKHLLCSSTWVIVKQLLPRVHEKEFVHDPEGTMHRLPDTDEVAFVLAAAIEMQTHISIDEIMAQASVMMAAKGCMQ